MYKTSSQASSCEKMTCFFFKFGNSPRNPGVRQLFLNVDRLCSSRFLANDFVLTGYCRKYFYESDSPLVRGRFGSREINRTETLTTVPRVSDDIAKLPSRSLNRSLMAAIPTPEPCQLVRRHTFSAVLDFQHQI